MNNDLYADAKAVKEHAERMAAIASALPTEHSRECYTEFVGQLERLAAYVMAMTDPEPLTEERLLEACKHLPVEVYSDDSGEWCIDAAHRFTIGTSTHGDLAHLQSVLDRKERP